ncbi:hypothetical protein [Mycolicibacterium sp. lyk4-40-TYG-92]|uniref:hypothetical protein n=1 Tax=Mycolicibacterium sp. lyk4-40-TYG-92 TaxID=3040295 RepID=UPI002549DC8F|nr:hypothetical protein [Mycolicibacterium sp. lyk4-40-TYG-92]
MRMKSALIASWIAAAAIGGAVSLAPIAGAQPDPDVPYGGDEFEAPGQGPGPGSFGFHESNHDEKDTSAGDTDVPY